MYCRLTSGRSNASDVSGGGWYNPRNACLYFRSRISEDWFSSHAGESVMLVGSADPTMQWAHRRGEGGEMGLGVVLVLAVCVKFAQVLALPHDSISYPRR